MINYSNQLDTLFSAMADPNRRAIIDQLSSGACSVKQLAEPLDISLPATLQHLAILESAGLVSSKKNGRVRTCSLNASALQKIENWISHRQRTLNQQLDALDRHLATSKDDEK